MNISFFTRLTGLLLVAGFFISCSTTKTSSIDELVDQNNYQQALNEIDARLENNPNQPELYIHKGQISALMAREESPELRSNYYSSAVLAFDNAQSYGASPIQMARIDSLKQQYWKFEHNAGLRVFENQSLTDRYEVAVIHFENAIILKDDDLSSYKNLAIAHFKQGNIDEAITNFKMARDHAEEVPPEIFENLGYLYLEKGDPDQAIYYYELANKDVTENFNLAFGLVNSYIAAKNHESATEFLKPLVAEHPQNANLRNVYGTQLYEITAGIMQDLKAAYVRNDTALVDQIRFEAEGMGEQAETQLVEAFKRDTANTDYLESLAVFYNNLAAQYFSVVNVAFDSHKAALNQKALSLVDFAIEYYSTLAEMDMQNTEYSSRLHTLKSLQQNRPSD